MGAQFRSYRDLEVWQKGMQLAQDVYRATSAFPPDERFGIVNQMRRAAVSIPSNIAEGHARRFRSIALGWVAELETQTILSADLGFLEPAARTQLLHTLDDIGKMLRGLYRSLSSKTER